MATEADRGLRLAIAAAGSRYALAKALGLSYTAVYKWDTVPEHRIAEIAKRYDIPVEVLVSDRKREERAKVVEEIAEAFPQIGEQVRRRFGR